MGWACGAYGWGEGVYKVLVWKPVRVIKWRRMRWGGHVARMGEERGVYRVLVGKLEGKSPLGRPRCRWVDNIRMDLQGVGCGYMDWIGLAQDRDRWRTVVSVVMNLRVPWNAGNFLTSCKPVSCSGRTLHRAVSKYCAFVWCSTAHWTYRSESARLAQLWNRDTDDMCLCGWRLGKSPEVLVAVFP